MTYDECTSLIDFLNDRLKKFQNSWYTWAVEITWEKLKRWGVRLGWLPPNVEITRAATDKRETIIQYSASG